MNPKADIPLGAVGVAMGIGPSMVDQQALVNPLLDVPFYETRAWLSTIAALGMLVIVISLANGIINIKRSFKNRD